MAAINRLCFALDLASLEEANKYINLLKGQVGAFKIGPELFISEGPKVVEMVKQSGAKCFLDLKLHDIPETVAHAVKQGRNLGVDFMTIHASGGPDMIKAAVETSRGGPWILAVVTLTSMNDLNCFKIYGRSREEISSQLMHWTKASDGFMCGVQELASARRNYPNHYFAVSGIRPGDPEGDKSLPMPVWFDDQKSIGTPAQAIRNGANLLVVGRPIRDSRDPQKAAETILRQIEKPFNL